MTDPDSGHPTPRDDEFTDEQNDQVQDPFTTPTKSRLRLFSATSTPLETSGQPRLTDFFGSAANTNTSSVGISSSLTPIRPNSSASSHGTSRPASNPLIKFTKDYIGLAKSNRRLEHGMKAQLNESVQIRSEKERVEDELVAVKEQMNSTVHELEDRISLLEECQNKIEELNNSLKTANEHEREVVAHLTVNLDATRVELEEASKLETELRDKILALQNQRDVLASKVEDLQLRLDKITEEAAARESQLSTDLSDLRTQLTAVSGEKSELQERLDTAHETLNGKEKEIHDLKQRLDTATEDAAKREENIEDLQHRLDTCVETASAKDTEHQNKLLEQEKELDSLSKQLADCRSELDSVVKERDELVETTHRLRKEVVEKETRLTEMKLSIDRLTKDAEVGRDHVDQLQTERHTLLQDKNSLLSKLTDIGKREIALIEDNNELREERQEQDAKISDMSSELMLLREKERDWLEAEKTGKKLRETMERERSEMETQRSRMTEELKALETRRREEGDIRSQLAESQELVRKMEVTEREIRDRLESMSAELTERTKQNEELEEIKSQLVSSSIAEKSTTAELTGRVAQLERLVDQYKHQVVAGQNQEAELQKELRDSIASNKELSDKAYRVEELEEINHKLSTEVTSLREAIQQRASAADVETLRVEVAEKVDWIEKLERELTGLRQKEAEWRDSAARVSSLNYEIQTRDDHIAKLKTELEQSHLDRDSARNDRLKMESERAQIVQEFDFYSHAVEEEKARMRDEIESLRIRLTTHEAVDGQLLSIQSTGSNVHEKSVWDIIPEELRVQMETLKKDSLEVRSLIEALRSQVVVGGGEGGERGLSPDQTNTDTDRIRVHSAQSDGASLADSQAPSGTTTAASFDVLVRQLQAYSTQDMSSSQLNIRDLVVRLLFSIRSDGAEDAVHNGVSRFCNDVRQLLSARTSRLEQELERLDRLSAAEREQRREAESQLRQLEVTLRDSEGKQRQLERDLNQKALSLDETSSKLRLGLAEIAELRQRVDAAESAYHTKCRVLANLEMAATQSKEVLLNLAEERTRLEEENDGLHEQLRAANSEVQRCERDLIAMQDELSSSGEGYKRELDNANRLRTKLQQLSRDAENELATKRYNQETMDMCMITVDKMERFNKRLIRRNTERQKVIEQLLRDKASPTEKLRTTMSRWQEEDMEDEQGAVDVYQNQMRQLGFRNTEMVDEAKRKLMERQRGGPKPTDSLSSSQKENRR